MKTYTTDEAIVCKKCLLKELVRCKDCKHLQYTDGKDIAYCHISEIGHDYDWFCADGKRRADNEGHAIMEKE